MKSQIALIVFSITLAATAAGATDLHITPPLIADPSLKAVCLAVNVSALPRDIGVTIVDDANTTLGTATCPRVQGSCRASATPTNGVVYCIVDVSPKRAVLVTLMLLDESGVVRNSIEAHYED